MKHSQIFIVLLLSLASMPSFGKIAVIVHPSNIADLKPLEVRQIFLGKTRTFPNGAPAQAFDADDNNPAKAIFAEQVLHKSLSSLNSYWSRMLFSSKGKPPATLSQEKIKQTVASNKHAIAYIDSSAIDSSVKVLFLAP